MSIVPEWEAAMHRVLSVLLTVALLAVLLVGCVGESLKTKEVVASGIPTQGNPTSPVDARLGQSMTTFGFSLLKQMAAKEDGNVVISPLSAHASVAMAYNGAAGDTAEQMALALSLSDLSASELNQGYGHMLASLASLPDESGVTLNVENSLWADKDIKLYNDFVETDRSYFGAQLETLDLQDRGSKDRINGWIAERTNDKITDLIDEIPGDVVMYLISAVYMKGSWSVPFDPALTASGTFAVGVDGSGRTQEAQVPLMRREGDFNHAKVDGTQAVRLPYGNGRMAMWIVLPAQTDGDPRDAAYAEIDRLAAGGWDALTTQAETQKGQLVMPSFEPRTKTNLADALAAMGMPVAFDIAAADFSVMSPEGEDLYISRVLHETYIAVDETGTEAAAATGTEMILGGALVESQEPFEMVVDRPFLFAIEDGVTGAMLFLGVIEDPR